MTTGDDGTTTQAQAAVWCGACGIPYAAETVYCANCGAPLAALAALAVEADTAAPGLPVPVNPIIPTAPFRRRTARRDLPCSPPRCRSACLALLGRRSSWSRRPVCAPSMRRSHTRRAAFSIGCDSGSRR